MAGELRRLWEWGFEFDGRRHPWGTLAAELPARDLRGGEQHGLPTIYRAAFAAAAGPVTGVTLQIAAEARLFDDAVLAELRARLDADLGPGVHEPSPHGPEKANSRWRIGGASVWLTAFPSDWGFNWGRSSGRLQVAVDRERVAEPYLTTFRGAGEPWMAGPGEVECFAVPQMQDLCAFPMRLDEIALALGRPQLRAAPPWVVERLAAGHVAIWHHPPSATRGIATPCCTWPFPAAAPPGLVHGRWAPARGAGYATLDDGRDIFLLARPGPAGLDAVAARLRELGVPLQVTEGTDWG